MCIRDSAKAFAAAGAIAVVAELDESKAHAVTREIESFGGRALAVGTDVSRLESVEEMAARVKRDLGRIDILVNNAGIFSTLKMRPFEQIPIEEWNRVLHVNVTGVMLCCRAVTPTRRAGGVSSIFLRAAFHSAGQTTFTTRPQNRR